MNSPDDSDLLVACLCAAWCGTCRDYAAGFHALAERFPGARFLWLDVEDEADLLDDYDVENFPTLLIQRGDAVLFFGTMLPHHELLERTVRAFASMTPDESRHYAQADATRRTWQQDRNLRRALAERDGDA